MQFRREQKYGRVISATAEAGYVDPRKDHWKQKKAMGGAAPAPGGHTSKT